MRPISCILFKSCHFPFYIVGYRYLSRGGSPHAAAKPDFWNSLILSSSH